MKIYNQNGTEILNTRNQDSKKFEVELSSVHLGLYAIKICLKDGDEKLCAVYTSYQQAHKEFLRFLCDVKFNERKFIFDNKQEFSLLNFVEMEGDSYD